MDFYNFLLLQTTARFLESELMEILRRSSKEPVGGAVHKWKMWPPALCLLLLLPSAYCSSWHSLTAPPSPMVSLLLLLVQSLYCSSQLLTMVPLLLLLVQPLYWSSQYFPMSLDSWPSFKLTIMAIPVVEFYTEVDHCLSWPSFKFKFKFCFFVDRSSKFWKLIECHELEIQIDHCLSWPSFKFKFKFKFKFCFLWIGVPNLKNWLNVLNWKFKLTIV